MSNKEKTALAFVRDIERRKLPIEPDDAHTFAQAILGCNPPRGWLSRVAQASQFVEKEAFEQDLDQLASLSQDLLQDNPYALLLSSPNRSDFWIYQQLQARGLPKPSYQFTEQDYYLALQTQNQLNGALVFESWLSSLHPKVPVCALDDFTISGLVVRELFFVTNLQKKVLPEKSLAFVNYASRYATRSLTRANIEVHHLGEIKLLDENLYRKDLDFLEKVATDAGDDIGLLGSDVLFWTYYKVPDNVPALFTGTLDFPPLIRPENFQPPYKN